MSEKKILVVDAELVKRIDDNRGDVGRSEFINLLIDSQLKEKEEGKKLGGVTRDEFHQFQERTARGTVFRPEVCVDIAFCSD